MEISYFDEDYGTRVSYIVERSASCDKTDVSYGGLLENIRESCSKTPDDEWSDDVIEDKYTKVKYYLNLTQKTAFAFLLHHNEKYDLCEEPTFNPSYYDSDYPDEDFFITHVYIRGADAKISLSKYVEDVFVDGFPGIVRDYFYKNTLRPVRNCCQFECWYDNFSTDGNGSLYSADYKRLIYSKGIIDDRVEKIEDGALSFLIKKELVLPEKITDFDASRAMVNCNNSDVKKFIFKGALTNLVVIEEKSYNKETVEYRINNDIDNVNVVDESGNKVNLNNDKYRKFVFAAPSEPNKTPNDGKIVTLTLCGAAPVETNYRWYNKNTNLWKCDVHVHLDYVAAIYPMEFECAVDTVMGTEIILLCRNNYVPSGNYEDGGFPVIRVFESVEEVERKLLEAGWRK